MTTVAADSQKVSEARPSWRIRWYRRWERVLQFALVLWVVRVPLTTTVLGMMLLGLAPQAQDLFVEFAQNPWRIPLFLLLMVFAWAMPTHYSARLLLDTDVRFRETVATQEELDGGCWITFVERATPRVMGLLTFAAVLIAIERSHVNLPIFSEPNDQVAVKATNEVLGWLAFCVVVTAALFYVYTVWRSRDADVVGLRKLRDFNRRLGPMWDRLSPGLDAQNATADASRNVGRLLLAGLFVIFVGIFLCGADVAAQFAPRSMAVPFILGGWLPFLSYLSGLGRQWRAPLILLMFVVISLFAVILGDNHSVRLINAKKVAGDAVTATAIPIEDAVTLWMRENKCETAPTTCPRPIVVAAAGGASRAGFFLATILGYFLQDAQKHGLDANQIRNRLFAISGVSGGSMGAVMVATALHEKSDSTDHPCVKSDFALWWGDKVGNWRDCLEALTSGDFLSADFFGFAFNDMLPFGWWRDRAAVLEGTWNDRYHHAIAPPSSPSSAASVCDGLGCPFLSLRPRDGHWIPLLVLNGTSEATGGRIVTTALAKTYKPVSPCPTSQSATDCPLFVDADRFHDLLEYRSQPIGWLGAFQRTWLAWEEKSAAPDDVRIDTAALNSARFPLISPAGSIRNKDQAIVDRIVDGGYFENYGALSAKEIALAVHAVEPGLAPIVIALSNDPNDLLNVDQDVAAPDAQIKAELKSTRAKQEQKVRAAADSNEAVTDIVTPLTTVINTRTAHGILGVDQLRTTLRDAMSNCNTRTFLIPVRVWPQRLETGEGSRSVSMSWWLSTLVQRHLHQQTELAGNGQGKNSNKNELWLQAIWDAMAAPPKCTVPK